MDLLEQSIAAAKALMKTRYVLHIRRGTEDKTLNLRFYKRSFYHLFGFHKIKEISVLFEKKKKSVAFQTIRKNKALLETITSSNSFAQIESRLVCICLFQKVLAGSMEVYRKTDEPTCVHTTINFSFLLTSVIGDSRLFYFFASGICSEYIPISLFVENHLPYHADLQKWEITHIH